MAEQFPPSDQQQSPLKTQQVVGRQTSSNGLGTAGFVVSIVGLVTVVVLSPLGLLLSALGLLLSALGLKETTARLAIAGTIIGGLSFLFSPPSLFLVSSYRLPISDDEGPLTRNAPFITSSDVVMVERMVELAELTEDDVVYDLRCGDGRLVVTAAYKSGCRGMGFDILPACVSEATENVKLHGLEDRVQIEEADMFEVDLSPASVVMTYQLKWMVNKLVPQFDQMEPGSRIIAHGFPIDGVEPDQVVEVMAGDASPKPHSIFIYTTPLKKNPSIEKGQTATLHGEVRKVVVWDCEAITF